MFPSHDHFGRFASVWQLVKKRTAFPYYTDKTRIDITYKMLDAMGGVPSFAKALQQVMNDTSATFPFPQEGDSTSNFYRKFEAAERFIDSRPEFFGYSNSVVYTNRYLPIQRGEFRRIYEPDMDAVLATVDDQLLLDLAAHDKLTPLIAEADSKNMNVVFEIPCPIQLVQATGPVGLGEYPFTFDGNKIIAQTLPLHFMFSKGGSRESYAANAFKMKDPIFSIPRLPIIQEGVDYPLKMAVAIPVWRKEVTQITSFGS